MRFSRWFPLEKLSSREALIQGWDIRDEAAMPGADSLCVVQVKGQILEDYPKGKSAMLWYGWGPLDTLLAQAMRCRPTGYWLRVLAHPDAEAHCARILRRFETRFGSVPKLQQSKWF
jgi:hypothetical protein